MNITTNDKFIAVKETWFMNEGTVINVTNVNGNIVSFAFNEDESERGYMDMATFETHFKKIEEKPVAITTHTITVEEIADIVDVIMENSEFEIHNAFGNCTTVYCRLPNGYIITESYSCANGDYDEELAQEICYDKIWDRVWELESYRLHCEVYEEDEVEVEIEADCENCDDYTCPDHPDYPKHFS